MEVISWRIGFTSPPIGNLTEKLSNFLKNISIDAVRWYIHCCCDFLVPELSPRLLAATDQLAKYLSTLVTDCHPVDADVRDTIRLLFSVMSSSRRHVAPSQVLVSPFLLPLNLVFVPGLSFQQWRGSVWTSGFSTCVSQK